MCEHVTPHVVICIAYGDIVIMYNYRQWLYLGIIIAVKFST